MPPKVLAKTEGAKGVLPVNAATRAAATSKAAAPRLKLEVRRLPPGLTEAEFEEILGDEWKLGNGEVDWQEYRQGKVKLSLGKLPEQSRCYVHLVNEAVIPEFEARFKAIAMQDGWKDKAGTYKNPDIKHLTPMIGYAPNQRTTLHMKPKTDNRQGTIDQEPDFMAFLEEQTQLVARPAPIDSASVDNEKPEKVVIKTTPLIEAIREKKASKAKAAENTKGDKKDGKKNDVVPEKPVKETKGQPAKEIKNQPAKESKNQQQKVDNASKEAVKAVNKQVASKQQQNQSRPASPQVPQQAQQKSQPQAKGKKASPPAAQNGKAAQPVQIVKAQTNTPSKPAANGPTPKAAAPAQQSGPGDVGGPTNGKQTGARAPRQRGNADGIKKMLQKDLAGIRAKNPPAAAAAAAANRPATPSTSTTPAAAPALAPAPVAAPNAAKEQSQKQAPKPPTAPKAQSQPKQQQNQQQSVGTVSTTKAYLKHANPSQGMTEILIQQALSQFGEVTNVTIDPRKGTAIALFKDPEALKKAFLAKKVPVANGSVEILEWKDRNVGNSGGNRGGGFRGGRGGGARGGRGGHAAAGNPIAAAPNAAATTATPAAQQPKASSGS